MFCRPSGQFSFFGDWIALFPFLKRFSRGRAFHVNDRLADYFTVDGMRSDAVHGKGSPV